MTNKKAICVVGNPNCGKTTLFNALTGAKQDVGNWPGVTVERKTGHYTWKGEEVEITDLPGIYSVTPSASAGEDERVARDYILTGETECVINIIDASNLERNLYLTMQLLEMRVPLMVVVNMLDVAKQQKMEVRLNELQDALGCPVVGIVASQEAGISELKNRIHAFLENPVVPPMLTRLDEHIAQTLAKIENELAAAKVERPRWFALQIMEYAPGIDAELPQDVFDRVKPILDPVSAEFDHDLDIVIATRRYDAVEKVTAAAVRRTGEVHTTLTERIDRIVLNRWLGLPIFLFVMYVMFLFTQNLGAAFIDFFDILVGGLFVDGLGTLLSTIGAPDWLRVILANGVGGGLQTVATFIPVVFFLFFFLAILEASGYMARAAFVMDRLMRALGLPGKAFVPLLVGFGCNVPAIMATRTMDRASDRIITIMMAPFMSCGARLPVYVLFATAFFPTNGQNLVFALYLIGIVAAIVTGLLLKRVALPGAASASVMEIPPYHIPTVKRVMLRTWDRLKAFVTHAGRMIVVIVACLSILNSLGTDGSFGNEDSDKSVLSEIGRTIVPVLEPMGVSNENWPAAVGIFTGVLAKEAVVGTMNSLYDSMARSANADAGIEPEADEEAGWSLGAIVTEATETVMNNLAELGGALTDPAGIHVDDLTDTAAAAESQEVALDTIGMMQKLFGGSLAAFSYLLMVLLYMPCGAAVAAVWREAGTRWTLFLCAWTTALGYSAATIVYRIGTFAENPVYSATAIAICLAILASMILWMKSFAKKNAGKGRKVIPIFAVR